MIVDINGVDYGTTSACAENTVFPSVRPPAKGNYLRVRGEYQQSQKLLRVNKELPPRARRIQHPGLATWANVGTTSACAENTEPIGRVRQNPGNYLRVRGEYPLYTCPTPFTGELPPRARRIHPKFGYHAHYPGTTSACAENTRPQRKPRIAVGNYLRVRGEYRGLGFLGGAN